MNRRALCIVSAALLGVLLAGGVAWAMSSAHYALEWFVPAVGTGATASSSHYAIRLTIGQAVSGGPATSAHARGCWGFWCAEGPYAVYLPLVRRL